MSARLLAFSDSADSVIVSSRPDRRPALARHVLSAAPASLVEPADGIASGEAEPTNALHSLLARQSVLVPVVRDVGTIAFHDFVKLGAKAFI